MQEENDIPYYSNMLVLSMLCKLYKKNKRLKKKKGKEETLKKVALGMIEKGLDDAVIIELTGFTSEEIEKLRRQ